jgi:hypothetical protein
MASAIRNVLVRIGADIAAYQKSMQEASKTAKDTEQSLNGLSDVGRGLANIGDMIGKSLILEKIGEIATAVKDVVTDLQDYTSEISAMSNRTGISAQKLQELRYASSQMGFNFDTLTSSVSMFTNKLRGVDSESGDAYKVMTDLGVSMKDAAGKTRDTGDIYMEVIGKLGDMSNTTDRNIKATALFGRSWIEVAPLLNAGSEKIKYLSDRAEELGLVMSDTDLNATKAYTRAMKETQQQIDAVWRTIAVEFLPVLTQQLIPWIKGVVIPALKWFAEGVGKLAEAFQKLDSKTQTALFVGGAIATAVGPAILAIGLFIAAIGAIGAPAMLVGLAVAGIIGVLTWLASTTDLVNLDVGKALGDIGKGFSDTFAKISDSVKIASGALGDFSKALGVSGSAADTNLTILGALWDVLGSIIGVLVALVSYYPVLLTATLNLWTGVLESCISFGNSMTAVFMDVANGVVDLVNAEIDGINALIDGAKSAWNTVGNWFTDMANGLKQTSNAVFGTTFEMGVKTTVTGGDLIPKITKPYADSKYYYDEARKHSDNASKAFEDFGNNVVKSGDTVLDSYTAFMAKWQKAFTERKAKGDAGSNPPTNEPSSNPPDSLNGDATKTAKEFAKTMEDVTKAIKSQSEQYEKFVNVFDKVSRQGTGSGESLMRRLKKQAEEMQKWEIGLDTLQEKLGSGNEGLMEELRKMGPSYQRQITGLAKLTPEKLAEYAGYYNIKQSIGLKEAVATVKHEHSGTITLQNATPEEMQQIALIVASDMEKDLDRYSVNPAATMLTK